MRSERAQMELDHFDHRHPSPKRIKESYTRFVDLRDKNGLIWDDISDAVSGLKPGYGLWLPEGDCWDRAAVYRDRKTGVEVPLDTPQRFRKFGPQIDVVKSGTTLRRIREERITLRSAFREVLGDPAVREAMRERSFRGIGFWSPRSRRHNIVWFDVPVEGQRYAEMFGDEFQTGYLFADAYQSTPSFSRLDRSYITPLRVLPVTEMDGTYYIEGLETVAVCGCEDAFHTGSGGKKKVHDDFEAVFKYANPEQVICRHNWAQRGIAEKLSREQEGAKQILVQQPRATGLVNPWYNLKTRTLIGKGRRPLKAEIGVYLGHVIGYMGPEESFDLSE
jgi:hypothetical protein